MSVTAEPRSVYFTNSSNPFFRQIGESIKSSVEPDESLVAAMVCLSTSIDGEKSEQKAVLQKTPSVEKVKDLIEEWLHKCPQKECKEVTLAANLFLRKEGGEIVWIQCENTASKEGETELSFMPVYKYADEFKVSYENHQRAGLVGPFQVMNEKGEFVSK